VDNLFLAYLSISTCFGRLWAHHQEKQPCLCDTWYLLCCVEDCHSHIVHQVGFIYNIRFWYLFRCQCNSHVDSISNEGYCLW